MRPRGGATATDVPAYGEATRTVVVPCELGLHLRVTSRVVILARRFRSQIYFCSPRICVNAKSIFNMLELAAARGERLSLIARGPDAARALQTLAELFESKDVLCNEAMMDKDG